MEEKIRILEDKLRRRESKWDSTLCKCSYYLGDGCCLRRGDCGPECSNRQPEWVGVEVRPEIMALNEKILTLTKKLESYENSDQH